MARRWTIKEEQGKQGELTELYVNQNKTITEIGKILGIAESSVFDRMKRLNIHTAPERKLRYCNKRHDIVIPSFFSTELAEFIGIMLGDGHLTKNQIWITFNKKEKEYFKYVIDLIKNLFKVSPRYIDYLNKNTYDIYVGSVDLVRFLESMGLVSNKVKQQVNVPKWIFSNDKYSMSFLKGFFDTDGSLYLLKFGLQMCFCNRSEPLLRSTREILFNLNYHPSNISNYNLYLTRRADLHRYITEIGFNNPKHFKRAKKFNLIKMGA